MGDLEAYSLTDELYGYHSMQKIEKVQNNMNFMIEWGSFAYNVIPFMLKNAPVVLSRIVVDAFKEIMHKFLEVYNND